MKKMMPVVIVGVVGLGLAAGLPSQSAQAQKTSLSGYYVNQTQKLVVHRQGQYLLVGDYQQVPSGRVKTYKIVNETTKGQQVTLKYRKMHWRYAHHFQEAAISRHFLGKRVRTSTLTLQQGRLSVRLNVNKRVRGLQAQRTKTGTKTYTLKAQATNPVAKWVTKVETQRLTAQNEALKAYAARQAALGYTVTQPAASPAKLQAAIQQAIEHDASLVAKPYLGQSLPQPIQL